MDGDEPKDEPPVKPNGDSKRPMWQWILIYVVVAAIVYFLIYYLFFRGNGGY
jgi:flagellar basal body-associated protein FliL